MNIIHLNNNGIFLLDNNTKKMYLNNLCVIIRDIKSSRNVNLIDSTSGHEIPRIATNQEKPKILEAALDDYNRTQAILKS